MCVCMDTKCIIFRSPKKYKLIINKIYIYINYVKIYNENMNYVKIQNKIR